MLPLKRLTQWLSDLAAVAIACMIFITIADIAIKNLFNRPIKGTFELVELLLVFAVFFGFAEANEIVNGQHVGHLWNYGLNTWGFEDTWGGGDHDFNDLVIQVDFTSASGHGWRA